MADNSERLRGITELDQSDEQRDAVRQFKASRGIDVHGPFAVMLHSPQVMSHAAELGRYLRYNTVLPAPLSEWAIMITARLWTQNYEWNHHYDYALKAGIDAKLLSQLARNDIPMGMSSDQQMIYDFCVQLQRDKAVTDEVYERALKAFGERGIIDLIGINGYYAMLAMMMNVARTYTDDQPLT